MNQKREIFTLPSGATVDLLSLNMSACRTTDDAFELLKIIQEKVIEIEFQIDCYGLGYMTDGTPLSVENHPGPMWEARAKKALAWSKLQKADAQHRLSKLAQAEKKAKQASIERQFIDVAKVILPDETFSMLLAKATDAAALFDEKAAA